MASHGVARTSRAITPAQKQAEQAKIATYRQLEDEFRERVSKSDYSVATLDLTTKLLRANPEYYTVWNVRRRSLISGSLSRRLGGSWPSRGSQICSATGTHTTSSGELSTSSSSGTPQDRDSRTTGKSGTTHETEAGGAEKETDVEVEASKEQLQMSDLEVLKGELGFTIPLLIDYPKCYWIWNFRRWALQQAIERLPVPIARQIWEEELGLVGKMLAKDRRNYHAWSYRRFVVAQLESPVLEGKSMTETEFEYTTKMINVDLSNFSAWHNRATLIPKFLDERGADDVARRTFLDDELALVREALNVGPEDQSLWYYHKYLVFNLVEPVGRRTIAPNLTVEERVPYILREIENIKDLLEDYADVKLIFEVLMEYTLAQSEIEERQPTHDEKEDVKWCLRKLRELDPMRNGRWDDVEQNLDRP